MWAAASRPDGTASRGTPRSCRRKGSGVVDYLGSHDVVLAEVELVADAYLARRVDQDVPQSELAVQLAQQEYLDVGSGLLLVAVQTCRKDLRVVEYEHVLLVEILDNVLEDAVFDLSRLAVDDHKTRVVAVLGGVLCDHILRELIAVLR